MEQERGGIKMADCSDFKVFVKEKNRMCQDIVRDKIIELCGDAPRIELFARQKVEGWDCWGNEVE